MIERCRKGDLVSWTSRGATELYVVTDVREDVLGGSALRVAKSTYSEPGRQILVKEERRDHILIVSHTLDTATWIDSAAVRIVSRPEVQ